MPQTRLLEKALSRQLVGGRRLKNVRSQKLFQKSRLNLVGGVNSPVRSFSSVGIDPVFIDRAKGAYLWDVDGNKYVDFVQSWGAIILGHADAEVQKAAIAALKKGASFGACHEAEARLAGLVKEAFPKTAQLVRFANSGTEATMTALRLARGVTGKNYIVKFAGGYHGHHESLLVAAGSGLMTAGVPSSKGVPEEWAKTTLVLPYNDIRALGDIFARRGPQIAAVIVEPVACNMGVVPPSKEFLRALRQVTKTYGTLLICDEVITGFRMKWGGYADGMDADLVTLGKIIGGGFPVGALAGKKEIMEQLAPLGGVYHAGTLSGNPVAMAAGIAVLSALKRMNPYLRMEMSAKTLADESLRLAADKGVPLTVNRVGGLLTLFFTRTPVMDYETVKHTDVNRFKDFFVAMLERGIYLPPSNFEAWFVGAAHTQVDLDKTLSAIKAAL